MKATFILTVLFFLLICNSAFCSVTDQLTKEEETVGWNMVKNFLSGKDKGEPVRFRNEILIKLTGNYTQKDSLGLVKLVSELQTILPYLRISPDTAKANIFLCVNLPGYQHISGVLTENYNFIPDGYYAYRLYLNKQIAPVSLISTFSQEQRDQILTFYVLRSLTGNRSDWSSTTVPGTIFGQDNPLESRFTALDYFVIQQIYAPNFDEKFQKYLEINSIIYKLKYHPSAWKPRAGIIFFSLLLLALFLLMQYGALKVFLRWQRYVSFWMLLSLPLVSIFAVMNASRGTNPLQLLTYEFPLFIFFNLCFVIELFFVNPNKPVASQLKVKFIVPIVLVIFSMMFYLTIINELNGKALISILLVTVLISGIRIGFENYKYNTRQEVNQHDVEMAKLQELKTKSDLQAINARINPHFLYNALNSIAILVHSDPDKTERMTLGLSDFLRYAINRQGEDMVALTEELEVTVKYLEIEKVRFGDRLNYNIETSTEANNVVVPRFVLQPLVENAVKHGITPMKNGGLIRIQCVIEGPKLDICVFDNGPDFSEKITSGYGLTSLTDKLSLIYGQKPELFWVNGDQKHLCVKIPLIKHA